MKLKMNSFLLSSLLLPVLLCVCRSLSLIPSLSLFLSLSLSLSFSLSLSHSLSLSLYLTFSLLSGWSNFLKSELLCMPWRQRWRGQA